LDGDGDLDLVEGNWEQPNRVYCNKDSCVYTFHDTFGPTTKTYGIALGDLDGDGDLDAFEANDGPNKVYFNDYPNIITSTQSIGNNSSRSVALADLDGDGDLDAAVANNSAGVPNKLWKNDGNGFFTEYIIDFGNAKSYGLALGDLDSDGFIDAFVANDGPNKVYLNEGPLTTDNGQNLGNNFSTDVALADLDGDGDLDAGVTNNSVGVPNNVWINDGSGFFTLYGINFGTAKSYGVGLADLDLDGAIDGFVANDGPNKVYLNEGLATTDNGQNLGNANSRAVALGDLDGDGDIDAFVGNYGGPNVVWMNTTTKKSAPFFASLDKTVQGEMLAYPNPFNNRMTVAFNLKQSASTTVSIYNSLGQEVMVLYDGYVQADQTYEFTVDTKNLPEGLYICNLQSGDQRVTKRMLLAR
jgi:hypothetical protein